MKRFPIILISAVLASAQLAPTLGNAETLEEMLQKAKERAKGKSLDDLVKKAQEEQAKQAAAPDVGEQIKGNKDVFDRLEASYFEAPDGWSAGDPVKGFGGESMGISEQISRTYEKAGKSIEISMGVWNNAEHAQSMAKNSLDISQKEFHRKIVTVAGRPSRLTYDDGESSWMSFFAGRVAVSAKAKGLTQEELISFMSNLDLAALDGI